MIAGLEAALAERGARVIEVRAEGARGYALAESEHGRLFARWSDAPGDAAILAHEARVRAIVGGDGPLRAPPVLASGTAWLLEAAIAPQRCSGRVRIDAVAAAAERIPALTLPPAPAVTRGEGGIAALGRRLRTVRAGIPLRDLLAASDLLRRCRLPRRTSHGDFHAGNVLLADGAAWVVDWELAGVRPVGWDLMQYWATAPDGDDRRGLFEAAVELAGRHRRAELEQLRYALAVATAANKLGARQAFNRDPAGARELLALVPALRR